jgi:hypothetical protein
MNACTFGSLGKRAILNPQHAAACVSGVGFAALFARLFRVCSASKIRPLAAKERSPLFLFGLFGRNPAQPVFSDFAPRFFGSSIPAQSVHGFSMALQKVLSCCKALQIFQSVVRFYLVNVMYLFAWVKSLHPTLCYNAMDQFVPHNQITQRVRFRSVRSVFSKDFPATRYSVKVVISTVLNTVHRKADHVAPFRVVTGIIV